MRTCIILLALIAIVVGGAYYFEFFTVSTEREEGKFTTSLTINTGAVKNAAETAEQKTKTIGESVKKRVDELTGAVTVTGTVRAIDESDRNFTVAIADEEEVIIHVAPASRVTAPHFQGLQVGDRVTVVYQAKEDKNIARTVTIEGGT